MPVLDGIDGATLRLLAFMAIFLVLALLELAIPKRRLSMPKRRRWTTNLGIVALDGVLLRLMASLAVPLSAVAAALWAERHGLGLLNWMGWTGWLELVPAIVVLDFAIWLQHVAAHKVPMLWRLHQVHHADRDIDVTTGVRFHPIEIGLSMLWKIAVVLAVGASPLAVLLFEIILNGGSLFTHANIALPRWLDRLLRTVIVTPDMHRVHHSVLRREHDTNYGFNFSFWDRLFGAYAIDPEHGHRDMTIGLKPFQTDRPTEVLWSLKLPFFRPTER
jgi:sterol desaturase/sphingolipid hydroxylase (fatty acid hydroxylase superfamily)